MLTYVHRNACHRDYKGCDSAHFKGAVCCIEFLSFLLIKRSVCVYKRIEVSESLQAGFLVFLFDASPKKIAPAEPPAGL